MGFEQTDGPELKLKKLEAGLRHAVETSQEEIALYARLLSISKPKSDPSFDLTPQRQKDLTISALCRRLQSLAAKRPLIIVLADAHWIDFKHTRTGRQANSIDQDCSRTFRHRVQTRI